MHGIKAVAQPGIDRPPAAKSDTAQIIGTGGQHYLVFVFFLIGLFRRIVDARSDGANAVDHRAGAAQHFHAVHGPGVGGKSDRAGADVKPYAIVGVHYGVVTFKAARGQRGAAIALIAVRGYSRGPGYRRQAGKIALNRHRRLIDKFDAGRQFE